MPPAPRPRQPPLRILTLGASPTAADAVHRLGDRVVVETDEATGTPPDALAVLLAGDRDDDALLAHSAQLALQWPATFCIAIGPVDALLAAVNRGCCQAAVSDRAEPVELAALLRRGMALAAARRGQGLPPDAADETRRRAESEGQLAACQTQLAVAHEQLRATRNEVVELELQTSIGQLVRGLAHELNNPLTAILGHAQRLGARAGDPDNVRRRSRILSAEAERCIDLVQRLGGIGTPHGERNVACDPAAVIDRACVRLHSRRAAIPVVQTSGVLPAVLAGPSALSRVIEHILDNALQAGATRVDCSGDLRHGRVRLHLDNDGATPTDEQIRHCLRPFYTTRCGTGHHGLGLCLASALLREMGGSLTLDQRADGDGARCSITLAPAEEPDDRSPAHPTAVLGTADRVLVVDDEPMVAELLTDLLADRACDTVVAGDRAAALAQLERGGVRAMLCDGKLPDGDGCELLALAQRRWPRLVGHCALLTGDPDDPAVRAAADDLAIPVLGKPFHIAAVVALIRDLV